jgi:hypothetical protein
VSTETAIADIATGGDRAAMSVATRGVTAVGSGIALCLFGSALVSWARFLLGGTLDVRELGRSQDVALGLAFAAAFAGAAVLYLAALGRARGPATRPLLKAAILIHLGASVALPLTSNDAFPNLAYGRLMTLGRSPSVASPADLAPEDPFRRLVDASWLHRVSVYGPILNGIAGACARTGSVLSAFVLFKLVALLAALSTLLAAYAFCRTLESEGAWAFCLVGFNPLLAWEVSAQAHNDGVMVLAATAFVWSISARREWLALLLLSLGFVAKLAVAPLLLLFLLLMWRRSPLRGIAMAAAAAGVVAALYAPAWKGLATLAGPALAAVPAPVHFVNSLGALPLFAARLLHPGALEATFLAWTAATGTFLGVQALRLALRATTLDAVFRGALVFTLLYECLGMLWFEPWYATWLLPLALGCRDRRLCGIVALYTLVVPLLYHPTELYGLAALGSHGLALALLWGATHPSPKRGEG